MVSASLFREAYTKMHSIDLDLASAVRRAFHSAPYVLSRKSRRLAAATTTPSKLGRERLFFNVEYNNGADCLRPRIFLLLVLFSAHRASFRHEITCVLLPRFVSHSFIEWKEDGTRRNIIKTPTDSCLSSLFGSVRCYWRRARSILPLYRGRRNLDDVIYSHRAHPSSSWAQPQKKKKNQSSFSSIPDCKKKEENNNSQLALYSTSTTTEPPKKKRAPLLSFLSLANHVRFFVTIVQGPALFFRMDLYGRL